MAAKPYGTFKPPRPRTYAGWGLDEEPAAFGRWNDETIDPLHFSKSDGDDLLKVIQYFVSDTAKGYSTSRHGRDKPKIIQAQRGVCWKGSSNTWSHQHTEVYIGGNGTKSSTGTIGFRASWSYRLILRTLPRRCLCASTNPRPDSTRSSRLLEIGRASSLHGFFANRNSESATSFRSDPFVPWGPGRFTVRATVHRAPLSPVQAQLICQ